MADGETILTADPAPAADPASTTDPAPTVDPAPVAADPALAADPAPVADPAPAVASYTDFTFPEGFTSNADQVKAFSEVALKAGLSQEQAQELLNVQSLGTQNTANAQQTAWDKVVDDWSAATKADKEIDVASAQKALEAIGTPELKTLFNEIGIGNNPEIVRAFAKVGELIDRLKAATGDDTLEFGNTSVEAKDKTAAEVLYPDLS